MTEENKTVKENNENTESSEAKTIHELDEMSPVNPAIFKLPPSHEYRVGHHKVPTPLLILYLLVFCWAAISWIPFYGY